MRSEKLKTRKKKKKGKKANKPCVKERLARSYEDRQHGTVLGPRDLTPNMLMI
jgi:ribosomal protein L1